MSVHSALDQLTRSLAGNGAPEAPHDSRVYLHPGHLYATGAPVAISTILGSCVGVCLYDPHRRVGGVNHFLLPRWPGEGDRTTRFGDVAMPGLLQKLLELGARRERLLARIYGGACVLDAFREDGEHLGARNADCARAFLQAERITVIDEDTGGRRGRKLLFHAAFGSTLLSLI
jgi:chemotaxis protein CheD